MQKTKCCGVGFHRAGNKNDRYNACDECHDECEIIEVCDECGGDGYVEIYGDGENFECDVIGTAPCDCTA